MKYKVMRIRSCSVRVVTSVVVGGVHSCVEGISASSLEGVQVKSQHGSKQIRLHIDAQTLCTSSLLAVYLQRNLCNYDPVYYDYPAAEWRRLWQQHIYSICSPRQVTQTYSKCIPKVSE